VNSFRNVKESESFILPSFRVRFFLQCFCGDSDVDDVGDDGDVDDDVGDDDNAVAGVVPEVVFVSRRTFGVIRDRRVFLSSIDSTVKLDRTKYHC
jgi:hypothetical protein